jgi:hypothetical protein
MLYLLIILLFSAIIWYWYDSLRANEAATRSAEQICQTQNCQFLDGTVAVQSIRLTRCQAGHMCLKRTFQFEYSSDYDSRMTGFIIMTGTQIEAVGLADDL